MRKGVMIMFLTFSCTAANAQLDRMIEGAEDVADIAELVAISADVLEATSYTKDKLKASKKNLENLQLIVKDPYVTRNVPEHRRREWATKLKSKIRTVEMYNIILMNVLKMLTNLKRDLAKQKLIKGEIGRAIKQGIANAMVYVKKIPVYGEIIDTVAGVFGAGSDDSEMMPIENAVLSLENERKNATLEEQLIEFLLRINDFNESVTRLERDTRQMSHMVGSNLGMAIFITIPNTTIRDYAARKNLKID